MTKSESTYKSHKLLKRASLLILFVLFTAIAYAQDPSSSSKNGGFDDPNMEHPTTKQQKAKRKSNETENRPRLPKHC
jgi:hypothetical protein